jgi:hypothetical protein
MLCWGQEGIAMVNHAVGSDCRITTIPCIALPIRSPAPNDWLCAPLQANVAVVIAAFKDGLQSQGFDFAAAPDAPAARNINVVG